MQLDDILELLGSYGRYQVVVYLSISLFDNLLSIWHMNVMPFIGYEPLHHCKLPSGASLNRSIPLKEEDGVWMQDQCSMYDYRNGTYDNQTSDCKYGWYYDPKPVKTSIVTDWDLVCSRNVLPETTTMVFNFGVMFGAVLFGFLSDKWGRKKAFVGATVLQSIVGMLVSLSPNLYVFMALRFLVGALEQGVNITGFVMATELFPPKIRTIFGVSHEFFWAAGGALLPLFAFFIRKWRYLQLAISLPGILAIVLWWFIPESVVWLISQGRLTEAEEILQRAAKVNKKQLPSNCLSRADTKQNGSSETKPMITDQDLGQEEQEQSTKCRQTRTYTFIDLFRTRNIRKISVCLCILWAINTMVYYGLSYNTTNLKGDIYLNFFIGQVIEIPSVALTLYLIYKVGRRWPLCISHILGGIVCILSPFIPLQTSSGIDITWISITLAMFGKFAINTSFTIIYIYNPEIYPTVLRNTGAGLGSFAGRVGGILFPYVNYLSKLKLGPIGKNLPLLVFGCLSIIGGLLALPLPETRHNPLPDTIADLENYDEFCRKHRRKNSDQSTADQENKINHKIKDSNSHLSFNKESNV